MSSPALAIQPFVRPASGNVRVPGSKSLTNRALILAALAEGTTTLTGALFSRDTRILCAALRQLGFAVETDEAAGTLRVTGQGGRIPNAAATLDVGNAGTAARFLTAFLCLHPAGRYALDGDPAMRERPMRGLLDALEAQGARLEYLGQPGHFPFVLHTSGLRGGEVAVDASASSQILSALLMAAPAARRPFTLTAPGVRPSFVEVTLGLLRQWGVASEADFTSGRFRMTHGSLPHCPDGSFAIEPDVTAASYFIALPRVTGGQVSILGLGLDHLQGDTAFAAVAERAGVAIERTADRWTIRATHPGEPNLTADFRNFSDTFLTLAALSPLLPGPVRIEGIAHTRKQETDRVAGMARELRKLGQRVAEEEGSLTIHPDRAALLAVARQGVAIETYEDHRFAMSFGILGCADLRGDGSPWLTVLDPACCGKTFPSFFTVLEGLRLSENQ